MNTNMASQPKTIDDYCRLCAIESQSGVIIYSREGESLCLEEKIISCLRIEVSRDDLLPKKVCQLCSELLDDYHRFSERAVQVQQTLELLLGTHTPCLSSDEMQLCLMQSNVKLESNVIKNELDELTAPTNNILLNGSDISLNLESNGAYHNDDLRRNFMISPLDENDSFRDFNGSFKELGCDVGNENSRQMQRRKMAQPKKSTLYEQSIKCFPEIGYSLDESNKSEKAFKSEDVKLFQGNDQSDDDSEVEREWRKYWGIICDQCQNVFETKAFFDKHYQIYYNKEPVYTCSYCKMSTQKYSEYRSHTLKHIYEGQFKCEFCEKKFCMEEVLQVHLMTHTAGKESFVGDDTRFECNTQKRLNSNKKKNNCQSQKKFTCPECGKVLQTRGGMTAHLTVHKLGRRFMCHICGKTFTQKINMQQHVKHHGGEKPYSCEDCGKSFTEKSHLNRHKSFHTLDRPYQCPVCKKMYKTERCLKVHSHVHLNTRPYVCSYCGKGFLSSTKLKQHYNCHTGERPFACKYCERAFTNYPNWLKHTRRRHKVDHKTGLSLKEESQKKEVVKNNGSCENMRIEFVEMPIEDIKDDADGKYIPTVLNDGSLGDDLNDLQEFEFNTIQDDVDVQYPAQLAPYIGFKQI